MNRASARIQRGDDVWLVEGYEKLCKSRIGALKPGETGKVTTVMRIEGIRFCQVRCKGLLYTYNEDCLGRTDVEALWTGSVVFRRCYELNTGDKEDGAEPRWMKGWVVDKTKSGEWCNVRITKTGGLMGNEWCKAVDLTHTKYEEPWLFDNFSILARVSPKYTPFDVSNDGRTLIRTGRYDHSRYQLITEAYIPKDLNGTIFFEIEIDAISSTNPNVWVGVWINGSSSHPEASRSCVYASSSDSVKLFPSGCKLDSKFKCKSGTRIRCELDLSSHVTTFFFNGHKLGSELLPDAARGQHIGPTINMGRVDGLTLVSSGMVGLYKHDFWGGSVSIPAPSAGETISFSTPGRSVQMEFARLLQNEKCRYSALRRFNDEEASALKLLEHMKNLKQEHHYLTNPDDIAPLSSMVERIMKALNEYESVFAEIQKFAANNSTVAAPSSDDEDEEIETDVHPKPIHQLVMSLVQRRDEAEQALKNMHTALNRELGSQLCVAIRRFRSLSAKLEPLISLLRIFETPPDEKTQPKIEAKQIPVIIGDANQVTHEWNERVGKLSIQIRTDNALSAFLSSLTNLKCGADVTSTCWESLKTTIDDEETWLFDVKMKTPFPAGKIVDNAFKIIGVLRPELQHLENINNIHKRINEKVSRMNRKPGMPSTIEELVALRENHISADDDLLNAQFELSMLQRKPGGRKRISVAIGNLNFCRIVHRTASKQVEMELHRLANLAGTYYPELPLLFPQADILGFAEASNNGLVKYGVSFDPRKNEGSFSDISMMSHGRHNVYKALLDGKYFAMKEYSMPVKNERKKMLKEAQVLRKLDHPAIVSVEGIILSEGVEAYVQMPYYPGGDMATWLAKHQVGSDQIRAVLHELARAIEHLHSHGIIHCDIKLENVFMTSDSPSASPKLGDFDISKDSESRLRSTETTTIAADGTNIYIAPEIINFTGQSDKASDIYAFGVLIFLSVSENRQSVIDHLLSVRPPEIRTELIKLVSSLSDDRKERNLILSMIDCDPGKRPIASHILQHSCSYLNVSTVLLELNAANVQKKKQEEEYDLINPMRNCIICDDSVRRAEGIECPDPEKLHFLCKSCFSNSVISQSCIENMKDFSENHCQVICPFSNMECSIDESFPFSDQTVAKVVGKDTFSLFLNGKKAVIEKQLSEEITAVERQRYQSQLQKMQQISDEQRTIELARREIEEIMVLKCPHCSAAFNEITEGDCMALNCVHCKKFFCAWCMEKASDRQDCHCHVARCIVKPEGADVFYDNSPGRVDWMQVTRERQCPQIIEVLKSNEQEIRTKIISAVLPILLEQNLIVEVRRACSADQSISSDLEPILGHIDCTSTSE